MNDIQTIHRQAFTLCQAHKRFNKVFGIGANKTASTSLQMAFHLTGLRVAPQPEGELTAQALAAGRFDPVRRHVDKYDAFQDVPFAARSAYIQMDVMFPDSRFILTWRDPDAWYRSFLDSHRAILGVGPERLPVRQDYIGKDKLYDGFREFKLASDWLLRVGSDYRVEPDWSLLFDRQHFIDRYVARNQDIVRYFHGRPDDLLVIDLTREKTTERIVEFLGLPRRLATAMPHLNRTPSGHFSASSPPGSGAF